MTKGHVTVRASISAIFLLVVAVTGFLPLVARGGTEARPLQLRLILPEPEVCMGQGKLKMEAVFSNGSDLPISVYTSSIYDFSFTKSIIRGKQAKGGTHENRKDVGTGDPALHEAPVVLQPHVSIVVPLEYGISDSFFGESGTYSVQVRYMKTSTSATPADAVVGDFGSNEVLFERSA